MNISNELPCLGNFRLFIPKRGIELFTGKRKFVEIDLEQFFSKESIFPSKSEKVPPTYYNIVIIPTEKLTGVFKGVSK